MNRNNNTLSTQLYRAIGNCKIDSVKWLLSRRSIRVNDTFDESNGTQCYTEDIGKTPLQYAVESSRPEIVELLLKHNANVNPKLNSNMTLIQLACQTKDPQIVKLLIDHGGNVNYVDPFLKGRYTCIHYAVESEAECTVQLLVNEGSFINATAENDITPLHIAAKNDYGKSHHYQRQSFLRILHFLLENGADVNAQTNDKKTALYFAAQAGHLSAVQSILKHNPDNNIEGNLSSLGVAISCDHSDGMKASYFTSQAKHMDILRDYGFSKPVSNIESNINYRYAKISCDHSTIVNLLIDYGLTLEPQHEYYKMFIFAAATIGHLKIIKNFLTSDSCDVNLSVDPSSENSTRILHTSIINNHTDISLLLIENGADVNVKDENNKSPVYYAITNNNTEVTKKLVAYHAEVQPILLSCAIRNDNLEIIEILVKCGVDINTIFKMSCFLSLKSEKFTPLLIAMKKKNDYVIQYLVEHDANVNFVGSPDGFPPLHYAVTNKNEKIVNILLNGGANINLRYGKDNRTVLCSAVQTVRDIEMIKLLLEKGADVNCQDKSGMTPLYYIIGQKKFNSQTTSEIIELLLKYNADINCHSKSGMTPLHLATINTEYDKEDDTRIIELLLKFGADIDSTNQLGYTALHCAIVKKKDKSFRTLLDNGADINIMIKLNENKNKYESLYKIATSFYEKQKYEFINTKIYEKPDFSYYDQDYDRYYDYCYDDSDYDEAWRPELKVIKMLKEHIIQLNQAKCWINEGNLQAVNNSEDSSTSSHILDLCNKEISTMKIEKIGNSCVTFHDVLMNDFDKFGRNKNVMEILELEEYKKKYPIYGKIITGNYRRAKFRIPVQKEFINLFCCQWDRFKELPYICVEKICTYLSLQDMRELINSVNKSC